MSEITVGPGKHLAGGEAFAPAGIRLNQLLRGWGSEGGKWGYTSLPHPGDLPKQEPTNKGDLFRVLFPSGTHEHDTHDVVCTHMIHIVCTYNTTDTVEHTTHTQIQDDTLHMYIFPVGAKTSQAYTQVYTGLHTADYIINVSTYFRVHTSHTQTTILVCSISRIHIPCMWAPHMYAHHACVHTIPVHILYVCILIL